MNNFLLIIDGSSLLSTQFYGNLPREIMMAKTLEEKEAHYKKIMQTSQGVYTNAVFGFLRALFKILEVQKPKYLAVTWDVTRNTFRRELYADYKGNRSETLLPLASQFELMQNILGRLSVAQFMSTTYEADDFSGSLAKKFETSVPVCILTKDHDYLQLANNSTTIWMLHSAQTKADELFKKYNFQKQAGNCPEKVFPLTPELIEKEFGICPKSVPALKGLQGDSSDNIKGVPGIGPQTAVTLIAKYKDVETLYKVIEEDTSAEHKELVNAWKTELGLKRNPIGYLTKTSDTELVGKKAAILSELLATIKTDIPIDETLDDLAVRLDSSVAKSILHELEISSIAVPELFSQENVSAKRTLPELTVIDDFSELESLLSGWKEPLAGIAMESKDEQETIYLSNGNRTIAVPISMFVTKEFLAERFAMLSSRGVLFAGCDIKPLAGMLRCESGKAFDCSLADYLLRPLSSHHEASELCIEYENGEFEILDGAAISFLAWDLKERLSKMLDEKGLTSLYNDIELPLISVLYEMEQTGIGANRDELLAFGETMTETISSEQAKIFELAGEEFNINSPKQLGEVLFEKLKLPYGKKTKSGYSTSADILDKLSGSYEVVEHVLKYRQLTKLKSTYVDGLSEFIREDGRIHSSFNQMITATGRLSSTDPNLQNIPIRFELGRQIRKVFVPKPSHVFLDADYSQIELRLMACMSGDESLIRAYKNNEDIHRATASLVFDIPYEEVTSLDRSRAKAVNFGIIYGISSFGLGQDLSISRKQANEYIENYFLKYPRVKQYLDELVEDATKNGAARSLYGRLRPIPELASSNFMTRQFGERVAMNMPIQGTAADIMKIAMLRVAKALKDENLSARLLLQVHDELLIETPLEEVDKVTKLLTDAMENAAKLQVPLEVEVKSGNNWYNAK